MQTKQVICVREDIKMSRGKMAVQVAHGSLGAYDAARVSHIRHITEWKASGQPKICLSLTDEKHMDDILAAVVAARLPYCVIEDAGLTELSPGTRTVLAIGPAAADAINKITGSLHLAK